MTLRVLPAVVFALIAAAPRADAQSQQQSPPPAVPRSAPPSNPVTLPAWLRVGVEHRGRLEGPRNAGFSADRDDAYWLNRLRFDVRVKPGRLWSFHAQAQDAQVFGRNAKPDGPPFEDTIDLRMAFAEIGEAGTSPAILRLGRQELAFGDQRLVGHVSWLNTARTFDAARVTVIRPTFRLDAFAGSVVAIRDGEFNRTAKGERFYGAYSWLPTAIPQSVVEPYAFVRTVERVTNEAGVPADLESVTLGVRWVGKLPARFDYNTEVALQRGSVGSDDVRAWAGHWAIGRSIRTPAAVRIFGEYNYASGDADPTDGRRSTFDQLYPTPHDKYGLADQVGWRNIHHLRAGVDLKPFTRVTLNGSYHSWWLASTQDSLYAAGGAVLARPVAGNPAAHLGHELDAQTTYTLTPRIQIHGGYAHIIPGEFLKAATPGKAYSLPYLMVTYTVLKASS